MNPRQNPTNGAAGAEQWRSVAIFAFVIATALVAHPVGSVSQVEFVYGGL